MKKTLDKRIYLIYILSMMKNKNINQNKTGGNIMGYAPIGMDQLIDGAFTEKEFGCHHEYQIGAPTEWAAEHGATHALYTKEGLRPARILKTVAYIGIDESDEGDIVWEKWSIKTQWTRETTQYHGSY